MAKTDFFKALNESSKMLEANLQGIAVPLAAIMLLSVASGLAGFFLSQAAQFLPFISLTGQTPKSTDDLGFGDIFWLLFTVLILLSLLVSWLTCALSLYIAQYFNAVMLKKKMPENWAGIMVGNMFRSLVMSLVLGAIFAVVFGVPAAMVYFVSTQYTGIALIVAGAGLFLLALLLCWIVSFFLAPLWLYYAVDKNGIFSSISKSISLVKGNLAAFFLLYVVFVAISMGAAMSSAALCCISFFVSPIVMALVTALYQITMIRLKIDSESQQVQAKK